MIKGTKTELNLLKAFAGESQARNRYTMYASIAKKEGYEQIAAIFLETSDNEREHASLFYKKLEGGKVEITAAFPAGDIGTTSENLDFALRGENEEWTILYKEFAEVAIQEGFLEIAKLFQNISTIEKHHEERFKKLFTNVTMNKVFEKEEVNQWVCRECGYIHTGISAPTICPVCNHEQAFYQLLNEKL